MLPARTEESIKYFLRWQKISQKTGTLTSVQPQNVSLFRRTNKACVYLMIIKRQF